MDDMTIEALVDLGEFLLASSYRFTTVTPETHRRVTARGRAKGRDLRDVFGWNLPFRLDAVPDGVVERLRRAGALFEAAGEFRSAVRFASIGNTLFAHSAYPTSDRDSVFFGPDTYRFCAFLARSGVRARRGVDVGCGSGAGGILSCGALAPQFVLSDISPAALALARVNAALSKRDDALDIVASDVLSGVAGNFDLIIANPPYMRDDLGRVYRDGGGEFGERLAVRITSEALERLPAGGTLLLYTGAAIVSGRDTFFDRALPVLQSANADFHYEELDPDVFGEELERPAYARVERIAAVGLRATLPA